VSYVNRPREPMSASQKWAAIIAVALMVPVALDLMKLIDLGSFVIVPFVILLIIAPTLAARSRNGRAAR
jgi:hypothetical protein